ncbi:xanthine dehydrogenase family protein molybdopterin-binding subunit [Nonomuraea sp. KC401]|uniref:xanthine dehydrogenase family protein molybdopterin-binding subunit n=1 Tax=unclassified Nonomuraea TaxID=2593643 RepID=UPI0010FD1CD4|nr:MULTISPECIES: xanthine dehydrogenase family protein molybdopterin-binding subunit [unclassified Nonomuraea]NBE96619.1 molybdopterin-dependent oxidoreductase [Nonomuraea sp. K271]TLF68352.1 xanthine dehydrogenase family protein molybdopterin-binding subunit [Nonomuraea sp. KC401]
MGDAYVGARTPRREDARLLTGKGKYVGAVRLPGMVHAHVIRSPIAHGRLLGCDPKDAWAADDVLDVITPADAPDLRLPCVSLSPGQRLLSYRALDDTIRYAGQPLAVVVARTPEAARDAADLVDLELDELPATAGIEHALEQSAPLLYPDWGTNLFTDFTLGDDDCATAVEQAEHVIEMTFRMGRVSPYALEPRGVVAAYADDELTVHTSSQAPHHVREHLADAFGLTHDRVRVVSGDTGGGFGGKEHVYPDEAIVCLAAMRLGRPVSWSEEPGDRLLATLPARAAVHRGRLALDGDGRFVALYVDVLGDIGAHPSNVGASTFAVTATTMPGPYRFDRVAVRVRGVVTNTTPTGSYRGFGQPEGTLTRERLIDEAARRLGADPVELRLRNMVRPEELPYTSRVHQAYDSGDYPQALTTLRDLVRFVEKDDGRRRGIGYSCHVETTGMGPSMDLKASGIQAGGYETAILRMEQDASVVVSSGVVSMGQGIETALAQVAADRMGVPIDRVRVVLGDTAATPYSSIGSVGSRSLAVGGGALTQAAARLRDKLVAIAAHLLEAAPDDLEVAGEAVRVKGDPRSSVTLREVATAAWRGWDLPDGLTPGLEERVSYDPKAYTFAYGAHAAAVAVDPETGKVELEGYWVVNDSGVLVNPTLVEGQIRGGVVQGIGMALTEEIVYSEDGQPVTDYLLPTTREVPDIEVVMTQTPSPLTPGGMKGVGESGTIGPPAAIANAVAAALPEIAGRITDVPLTPASLWSLL